MNKKPLPKRKAKRIVKFVLFLFLIFFVTILLLFIFSLTFLKNKAIILNPIGYRNAAQLHNQQISPQISDSMKRLFDEYHLSIESIATGTDSAMLIFFTDGKQIIFSKNKGLDSQIASLQLIMNRLTIEGKQFSLIDLRFENPVITF